MKRAPRGESFAEQVDRVETALEDLPPGDHILVVHSGTIRATIALALGRRCDLALQFVTEPLSVTRIDRVGPHWRIEWVNRT